jgi:outer membrane murein-binding lipoprotein Lpp
MRLMALSILGLLVLTGCSELQVIGKATVRELSADAISVEKERYQPRPARQPKKDENKTMVAQSGISPVKAPATQVASTRELWRH